MELLKETIYSGFIKENISRVLTQVDRDCDSKTDGCCDRNYLNLKIRDFTSAILQQTCLTMALMYKIDFEGNYYYKNNNMREWAIAAVRYMGNIQLRDGSFNEYYPNEHGFPPTAFSLFAACKTYIELELEDKSILDVLKSTAVWLTKHHEEKAYNQEIAAISGLYLYYKITKDKNILDAVDIKVERILSMQSEEGWFPEQGGADIGYSSVAFDMLMEYYAESKDKRVLQPLHKLLKFLSYFVHPDGTIGGEYGSRNTIYFMPNGLETYIALGLDSAGVAQNMVQMLYKVNPAGEFGDFMQAVDERYLTHYVLHSYLRALQKFNEREIKRISLPFNTPHTKIFEDAGLITTFNEKYYAIISMKKGGIVKIYKDSQEIFWDCGYRIPVKKGTTAATNWLDKSYEIHFLPEEGKYCVKGVFNVVTPKVQNPFYHLGLRVSAFLLGNKVNRLIKRLTIFQDKHYDATFERNISLKLNEIIIEDIIINPQGNCIREASNFSLRLVASGKFFSRSDLLRTDLRDLGNLKSISIKKIFDINTMQLKTEYC